MLWWLAACRPDETPPPTDSSPTGETESSGAARTGLVGSVQLLEYAADAVYTEPETVGAALFAERDGGIRNLAGCVLLGEPCFTSAGSPGEDPAQTLAPESVASVDAGPFVRVGGGILGRAAGEGGPTYGGEGLVLGSRADLSFDGDLVAFASDAAFTPPAALTGLSPAPDAAVVLGDGEALALGWDAGGPGEVSLRWPGTSALVARPVDDAGHASLTAAELGLRPPLDATWVALVRETREVVDAAGNEVVVTAGRMQYWWVDLAATDGWTDLGGSPLLADACGAADPLPDGDYVGTLADASGDFDLGADNPWTGWATAGRDRSFAIDLAAGDALEVTFRQVWLDAALIVLDDGCATVLAAQDAAFESEEEALTFVAPAAGRYHVVLDTYGDGQGERYVLTTRTIPAG